MEVDFPAWLLEICEASSKRYPGDIPRATRMAERNIRNHSRFDDDIIGMFISTAIRRLIGEQRHQTVRRIKKKARDFHGSSKVSPGKSPGVKEASKNAWAECYNMPIAGTTLGALRGGELADISASELALGNGHLVNADLTAKLNRIVPLGHLVRLAVPAKKLHAMLRASQRKYESQDG